MQIPKELGHQITGVLGACWSDGYPSLTAFAEALERIAYRARQMQADQIAKQDSDRIIG